MRIEIQKNAQILAIFAIACTAVVGIVNMLTKDKIAQQEQYQLLNTLNSLIAPERYNNNMYQDCTLISDPLFNAGKTQKAYLAKLDDQPIAAAITTTAPDGYNGNIHMLVAVNLNGSVSGVRVLKHQETPGLGDKIEERKSNWINNFTDKIVTSESDSRWAVAKDGGMFDQFTGATITPRAVVKAVKDTVIYFKNNQQALFSLNNACIAKNNRGKTAEVKHEIK